MKKKLVSLLSLILVMVMVLPVMPTAVFAATTAIKVWYSHSDNVMYDEGEHSQVSVDVQFVESEDINKIEWFSSDTSIASFTLNENPTAKSVKLNAHKPGSVQIYAKITYNALPVFETEHVTITVKDLNPPVEPVFEISCDKDAIYDKGTKTTAKLSVPAVGDYTPTKIKWNVNDEDIFAVDANGNLTAKKAGTTTVSAFVDYVFEGVAKTQTLSKTITVTANVITSLSYDSEKTVTNYVVNQPVDKKDLHIIAHYTDGTEAKFEDYTYTPTAPLATDDNKITVKLNGVDDLVIRITVADYDVIDMIDKIEIVSPIANQEYELGDKIFKEDIKIKITYYGGTTSTIDATSSDVTVSGTGLNFSKGYHTVVAADVAEKSRTINVSYAGIDASVTIKFKSKETETQAPTPSTPSTPTYTITKKTNPTKTTYKVGEKFDAAGMTFQVVRNTVDVSSRVNLTYPEYTFVEADRGSNKSLTLNVTINYGEESVTKQVTVTGLTVTAATDSTRIREITSVTLKDDVNFVEGTEITLADIEKIRVKFIDNTTDTIYSNEFANYEFTSDLVLEVYTSEGARKTSSTYRDTIRPDDIYEDDDGDKVVNLALRYKYYTSTSSTASDKDGVYKIVAPITEADVAYYFKTKYITEYEDLEDALLYCNTQDDDIDENVFDISDVDEDDYLQLKLGKSFTLSSSYEFTPDNNIVIDLNGRNLTLYSDTFEFDEYEDFTITVKNTAANEAKLTYKDKDITIVLKKGDSVSFDEDNTTPGIYTVTVKFDSAKGTVTASPAISSGKITAGKGTEIKFTITPKTGYDVDTVKADAKSVVTDKDNYSVNTTTGVATYTLESLTKDITFEATFKAQKKAWQNPFSDVKSTANYYSAVEFVYENELFKGTTNTTFSPNTTMTRAMFVTVLGRLAGIDEATAARKYGNDSDFTDVSASNGRISYAVPYIKWAVENGIVEGYGDGTFGPENEITHQQMYVMMYRYARFVENKGGSFSSVSLSMSDRSSVADWATDAVKYAQYNDYLVYTNNTKTLIDPTGDAKRSELAMLLEQFCATVLGWAAE